MSRTVFCRKYQKEMEGLAMPPMPGPKGQEIFDNVSKVAWEEWQNQQTMLINEKHLSMMDRTTGNTCRPRWNASSITSRSTKQKASFRRKNELTDQGLNNGKKFQKIFAERP